MKKTLLMISMLTMFAVNAMALTIEMENRSEHDYIRLFDYETPMMSSTFGKTWLGKKYGVLVHIPLRGDDRMDFNSIYYPVDGKLVKEDKLLYYVNDDLGEKILLAKKNFWGYKRVDGVTIVTDLVEDGFYYNVEVKIEVN